MEWGRGRMEETAKSWQPAGTVDCRRNRHPVVKVIAAGVIKDMAFLARSARMRGIQGLALRVAARMPFAPNAVYHGC